jgi:hypothetical protein
MALPEKNIWNLPLIIKGTKKLFLYFSNPNHVQNKFQAPFYAFCIHIDNSYFRRKLHLSDRSDSCTFVSIPELVKPQQRL